MIASTQVINRNHRQNTSVRSESDDFFPAIIIFPLIIAIWIRLKWKAEIPHCFAIFISIFLPLIVIALTLESDAPLREVGAILIGLPLGWWIKTLLTSLLFEK